MGKVNPVRHVTSAVLSAVLFLIVTVPSSAKEKSKPRAPESATDAHPVLWSNPTDIAYRNLFYGPGGKADEPHTTFTFLQEDRNGSNPKFDVQDENATKWRVKLGPEVRPETVATRLLWAVGYVANEDYFMSDLKVENMQPLKRGQKLIAADGTMHNVRLKRYLTNEKKIGNWDWQNNPFSGTREFNGLRVMMALMNAWDLKTVNNSVYFEKDDGQPPLVHYVVSDVGSTFGTTGISFPVSRSEGNFPAYSRSKFIRRLDAEYVDFNVPTRPSLWRILAPKPFMMRLRMRWIGRRIPRADARWIGQVLSQLSSDQIRQAFLAAGYSTEEAKNFATVVEQRIHELNQL